MKTLLIIPAYNEEESLKSTIDSILEMDLDVDFLVINDGSKDNTAKVCREYRYPFLDLPTNLGLEGAFQAGMKYAYRHEYECAIQFDADGQHLPKYIPLFENAIKENDIVIGSRFVNTKKPLTLRMFGSNLIALAIRITTGKKLSDPTSGMRAFNKRMIKYLATGLNFGPEPDTVSYLIKSANAKVIEVSVTMAERTAGESYLNLWNSVAYMLRMFISILFMQLVRRRMGEAEK